MKHGIYYAYWEDMWGADYLPYIEKVAKLGFDFLEIGCAPLNDFSMETLKELRNRRHYEKPSEIKRREAKQRRH